MLLPVLGVVVRKNEVTGNNGHNFPYSRPHTPEAAPGIVRRHRVHSTEGLQETTLEPHQMLMRREKQEADFSHFI